MAGKRERARLDPDDELDDQDAGTPGPKPKRQGNWKAGPGRPKGSINKLALAAQKHARATGEMPHEFLLRVARGELISVTMYNPDTQETRTAHQIADLPMRVDAAKAAAPYYAPKLSAVEFSANLSDGELDDLIVQLATEAGLGAALDGKGPAPEAEDGAASPTGWL